MQQTNRIIAVADCMERLYFFNRMKWLDTIVVDAFPVMCVGYFAGAKMHYVKNKKFEEIEIPESLLQKIKSRKDYRANLHTKSRIRSILNYLKKYSPKTVLIFNDSLKHNPAWVEICRYLNINYYTIEISNFPGKLQLSKTGVNGNFTPISKIGNTNYSKEEWIIKKKEYYPDRFKMYGKFTQVLMKFYSRAIRKPANPAITTYKTDGEYEHLLKQLSNKKIIFFAQLTSDTNLRVHYGGNQELLIKFLEVNRSKFEECLFVYHPLSRERTMGMGENISVYEVPNDYTVLTINSTVALEAILLGLPVTVLGKSILNNLPEKNCSGIVTYLNNYCADIEYFDDTEIQKFI